MDVEKSQRVLVGTRPETNPEPHLKKTETGDLRIDTKMKKTLRRLEKLNKDRRVEHKSRLFLSHSTNAKYAQCLPKATGN